MLCCQVTRTVRAVASQAGGATPAKQSWLPGTPIPPYLEDLPAAYGFDPLRLGTNAGALRWCALQRWQGSVPPHHTQTAASMSQAFAAKHEPCCKQSCSNRSKQYESLACQPRFCGALVSGRIARYNAYVVVHL